MNMPVGITVVAELLMIDGMPQLFQTLVPDFKSHCRLQKADRLVGILPLWPSRSQFVCRAADSLTASVQDVYRLFGPAISLFQMRQLVTWASHTPSHHRRS